MPLGVASTLAPALVGSQKSQGRPDRAVFDLDHTRGVWCTQGSLYYFQVRSNQVDFYGLFSPDRGAGARGG